MLCIRTAWQDVFSNPISPSNVLSPKLYKIRRELQANSHYIANSFFNEISSSSTGGALFCNTGSSSTKLLIECSSFKSCHSGNRYAGAIYFKSGQCCFYKVCGYDCSITSDYAYFQFAYVYVTDNSTYINNVNDSSITYSINNYDAWYIMNHYNGKINIISVNLSHNKCSAQSAIRCHPSSTSSSDLPCLISLSSFTNNTAHMNYYCLDFENDNAYKRIQTSSILHNTQKSSSYGIICSSGNLDIIDSCILENDASHKVLYARSGSITIKNCTIEDNIKTDGSVDITDKIIVHLIINIDCYVPKICMPQTFSCFRRRIGTFGLLTCMFINPY